MKSKLRIVSFFFIVMLFLSVWGVLEIKSSIYPYATDVDYQYDFINNSRFSQYEAELIEGSINLGAKDYSDHTVFINLTVNSGYLGKYFQPSITLRTLNGSVVQYLEHGAEGIRYINISSLPLNKNTKVDLSSNLLSIENQKVNIISFKNDDLNKQKVLVISPHPDDAEIAAFGLYSSNANTHIVTITAGDAGDYAYKNLYPDIKEHYLKVGELRTWNSIAVPLLGGIPPNQSINLGFFNGKLKEMYENQGEPVSGAYTGVFDINTFRKQDVSNLSLGLTGDSSWSSLVTNLVYLLKEIKPDVIVTPYPALDSHSDHKYTTIALLEAIKQSKLETGSLYLYTNHFYLNEYFPYGKSRGGVSLPPNFSDSLYFERIYSHGLSSKKQKNKFFALDSMNDLRPGIEWQFFASSLKTPLRKIKHLILGDNTYYKRAVRSNELFFVVDVKNTHKKFVWNKLNSLNLN